MDSSSTAPQYLFGNIDELLANDVECISCDEEDKATGIPSMSSGMSAKRCAATRKSVRPIELE